jgi:hypothetical protein
MPLLCLRVFVAYDRLKPTISWGVNDKSQKYAGGLRFPVGRGGGGLSLLAMSVCLSVCVLQLQDG